LADYMGLPYDHMEFSEKIGMTHMVLMCELPHGKLGPCTIPPEGFDTLWTPLGYCVTFNEKFPEQIYKVRAKIIIQHYHHHLSTILYFKKCLEFILDEKSGLYFPS
jgi:hypothetical protein